MSGEASQLSRRRVEYLISIFRHSKKRGYARQYELIRDLGVSKPTASLMVRKLRDEGLLEIRGGKVMLNRKGEKTIQEILWKHGVIESALVKLGLSREGACELAWKIIQELSNEMVKQIWEKLGLPDRCPCGYPFPKLGENVDVMSYEACLTFRRRRALDRLRRP
ncbi:MAG TPA: metal-dependent transcriptional regulator [Nitrososphaeria archaeon]|nr:metal-dependent transcriptional regulator [Nitrososphaeria archaeon]